MIAHRRLLTYLCLLPGVGVLVILFAGPLVWSLAASLGLDQGIANFTLEHYATIFTRASLRSGLAVSLYYGVTSVLLTLVLAIGLAQYLRRHFAGRLWFCSLYKIPMAVPGIIAALLVLTLAERGGFLDRLAALAGLGLPRLVRDPWGIGVVATLVWKQLPFMTLVITGAFAAIPHELSCAARTLGAGRWSTLLRVELPLALPGISAAMLLSFIGSMGTFAIPDLIGPPSPRPLALHMYAEFGTGNLQQVYALGILLSLISVGVLLAYYAVSARAASMLRGAAITAGATHA